MLAYSPVIGLWAFTQFWTLCWRCGGPCSLLLLSILTGQSRFQCLPPLLGFTGPDAPTSSHLPGLFWWNSQAIASSGLYIASVHCPQTGATYLVSSWLVWPSASPWLRVMHVWLSASLPFTSCCLNFCKVMSSVCSPYQPPRDLHGPLTSWASKLGSWLDLIFDLIWLELGWIGYWFPLSHWNG